MRTMSKEIRSLRSRFKHQKQVLCAWGPKIQRFSSQNSIRQVPP